MGWWKMGKQSHSIYRLQSIKAVDCKHQANHTIYTGLQKWQYSNMPTSINQVEVS